MKIILSMFFILLSSVLTYSQEKIELKTREEASEFTKYYYSALIGIDRILQLMEVYSQEYSDVKNNQSQLPRIKKQLLSLMAEIESLIFSKKFNNIYFLKHTQNFNIEVFIGKDSNINATLGFPNTDKLLNTSISEYIKNSISKINSTNAFETITEIQRAIAYFRVNIAQAKEVYHVFQLLLVEKLNYIF